MTPNPVPTTAMTASAMTMNGSAMKVSTISIIAPSTLPRRNPATSPQNAPNAAPASVPITAMASETRAPKMILLSMSRPS
ncbi:MAG: hypothetical protein R2843_15805 [Thermomicrobiales bacterium]